MRKLANIAIFSVVAIAGLLFLVPKKVDAYCYCYTSNKTPETTVHGSYICFNKGMPDATSAQCSSYCSSVTAGVDSFVSPDANLADVNPNDGGCNPSAPIGRRSNITIPTVDCFCVDASGKATTVDEGCKKLLNISVLSGDNPNNACSDACFKEPGQMVALKLDENNEIPVNALDSCKASIDLNTQVTSQQLDQAAKNKATEGQIAQGEFNSVRGQASKLNQLAPQFSATAQDVIALAIKGLMMFMGAIMFVLVVYAGILWMTAQGNGEKIEQAKQIIVWATLGVGMILVSYVVVNYLFTLFAPSANQVVPTQANDAAVQSLESEPETCGGDCRDASDCNGNNTPSYSKDCTSRNKICCLPSTEKGCCMLGSLTNGVRQCLEDVTEDVCSPDGNNVVWVNGECLDEYKCNYNGGTTSSQTCPYITGNETVTCSGVDYPQSLPTKCNNKNIGDLCDALSGSSCKLHASSAAPGANCTAVPLHCDCSK